MSTILKALRKLEAQSRPLPDAVDTSRLRWGAMPRETVRARIPPPVWVSAIVLLVAVAAAAAVGWLRRPDEKPGPAALVVAPVGSPIPRTTAGPDIPQHGSGDAQGEAALSPPRAVAEASAPLSAPPAGDSDGPELAAPLRPASDAGISQAHTRVGSPAAGDTVTVQAIAWSAEAHNRIAVINGQVLHEGETIGRFRLSRIEKDHVVLSDGGRYRKVEFGR